MEMSLVGSRLLVGNRLPRIFLLWRLTGLILASRMWFLRLGDVAREYRLVHMHKQSHTHCVSCDHSSRIASFRNVTRRTAYLTGFLLWVLFLSETLRNARAHLLMNKSLLVPASSFLALTSRRLVLVTWLQNEVTTHLLIPTVG